MRRLLLLIPLAFASCGGGDPPARSVMLITLDTTRADAVSCYGAPDGVTPNLDALAAEGILYTEARTVAPITMPSHASMLTGLYPPRHTVRANSLNALPASARTLAEDARAAGLETAAFVASIVLADGFGLAQGFDVYKQPDPPPAGVVAPGQLRRRGADWVADDAIVWLRKRDNTRPFFAWLHFYDPHVPYNEANPFRSKTGGDGYLAEVASMDHAIGRVFDQLKKAELWDDTMIVVVADHGEGLGEHEEATHTTLVYESTMRVPFIVRYPTGERAGERSNEIVSVVDVYPTVIDGLGLSGNADVDGVSLLGARAPDDRGVYMESYYGFYSFGWSPLAAWADREGKYIHSSAPEFYDVAADPGELQNVIEGRALDRYRDGIEGVFRRSVLERDEGDMVAASMVEQLQGLGYTGAGPGEDPSPSPLVPSDRPAPRQRIAAFNRFLSTQEMVGVDPQGSVATLEGLVTENPYNHSAWLQLSAAYMGLERYEESIAAARKALEHGHDWYGPHNNIGIALDRLGRTEEALAELKLAAEHAPGLTQTVSRIVAILKATGRDEEAKRYDQMLLDAAKRR